MQEKDPVEQPTASSMGRKGGANSRRNMPPERATEIGRNGAIARWGKKKPDAKNKAKR